MGLRKDTEEATLVSDIYCSVNGKSFIFLIPLSLRDAFQHFSNIISQDQVALMRAA